MAVVTKKFTAVSAVVPLMAFLSVSKRNASPPSKSIITSVMVVNIGPAMPKSSGEITPKIGPSSNPITISKSTSGMRFRSKIPVNRCDTKTIRPTKTIIPALSIKIYLLGNKSM